VRHVASVKGRVNATIFKALQRVLAGRGYEIVADKELPPDYDQATIDLIRKVTPYTLTSHERIFALRQAVTYVVQAAIPGAIVECGVWRGGSMLVVAHTLIELGKTDRDLYLFDTFESMPPPGRYDVDAWGTPASEFHDAAVSSSTYSYLPQDQVRALLIDAGYPAERLHFVKGMVEETIPAGAPHIIALCRLDTDWYESTAHEMNHLYRRISPRGVLLIDDYGHFLGCQRAVDEYLEKEGLPLLLHRIDYTGRMVIVPSDGRG
jgi:hypothetical protein